MIDAIGYWTATEISNQPLSSYLLTKVVVIGIEFSRNGFVGIVGVMVRLKKFTLYLGFFLYSPTESVFYLA